MLTIEELKNLQVGDWVWIEVKEGDRIHTILGGRYYKKRDGDIYAEKEFWCSSHLDSAFSYSEYGTKWLAYKNKEEAEGKSISLPYLLCTSNKFACVIWRDKDGKVKKTYTMPIEEAKGVLKEKEKLCNTND